MQAASWVPPARPREKGIKASPANIEHPRGVVGHRLSERADFKNKTIMPRSSQSVLKKGSVVHRPNYFLGGGFLTARS